MRRRKEIRANAMTSGATRERDGAGGSIKSDRVLPHRGDVHLRLGCQCSGKSPRGAFWWAERAFEGYMVTGPRTAPLHAQPEIAGPSEKADNSSFGHCLVTATVRRVFKGAPSLKSRDLVTLRGLCAGLNEKTAGIPISADATDSGGLGSAQGPTGRGMVSRHHSGSGKGVFYQPVSRDFRSH